MSKRVFSTANDGGNGRHGGGGLNLMAVKGFEPPRAIIFSVGISIKIFLLAQFGLIWPT